jgi:hypothetical protein
VIGIGLSAGVQALDVALAMSLAFNFVVLLVWKHNVGSIYSGSYGRTGILSVGDPELMVADDPGAQREIRRRMLEHDGDMRTDGILLVHSGAPDLARLTVQEALGDTASDWRLVNVRREPERPAVLEYLVRLKTEITPPSWWARWTSAGPPRSRPRSTSPSARGRRSARSRRRATARAGGKAPSNGRHGVQQQRAHTEPQSHRREKRFSLWLCGSG